MTRLREMCRWPGSPSTASRQLKEISASDAFPGGVSSRQPFFSSNPRRFTLGYVGIAGCRCQRRSSDRRIQRPTQARHRRSFVCHPVRWRRSSATAGRNAISTVSADSGVFSVNPAARANSTTCVQQIAYEPDSARAADETLVQRPRNPASYPAA